MKKLIFSLFIVFLFAYSGNAQTIADAIAGNYTRETWSGAGMSWIQQSDGSSVEVAGYTTASTSDTLILDKNHCAALSVISHPADFSFYPTPDPIVYFGIWRMSGDTVTITYTKYLSYPLYPSHIICKNCPPSPQGITQMSELMVSEYIYESGGSGCLVPLNPKEKDPFFGERKIP